MANVLFWGFENYDDLIEVQECKVTLELESTISIVRWNVAGAVSRRSDI